MKKLFGIFAIVWFIGTMATHIVLLFTDNLLYAGAVNSSGQYCTADFKDGINCRDPITKIFVGAGYFTFLGILPGFFVPFFLFSTSNLYVNFKGAKELYLLIKRKKINDQNQ